MILLLLCMMMLRKGFHLSLESCGGSQPTGINKVRLRYYKHNMLDYYRLFGQSTIEKRDEKHHSSLAKHNKFWNRTNKVEMLDQLLFLRQKMKTGCIVALSLLKSLMEGQLERGIFSLPWSLKLGIILKRETLLFHELKCKQHCVFDTSIQKISYFLTSVLSVLGDYD